MDKDYYEILGLSEDEITYFLAQSMEKEDVNEDSIRMRDEIIRQAFENKRAELEKKYHEDLEKLKKDYELKKELIEYGKKFNKNNEMNAERIEDGVKRNELEYKSKLETIEKQHEIDVQQLELAYEQLSSEASRRSYNEQLNVDRPEEEMKKISDDVEKKYRMKKYDKHDQYNPDLLETINDGKLRGEKAVIRKPNDKPTEIALNDERDIRIKQTATIYYRNATGTYNSYIYEYEITRKVGNEEKTDKVYSEISLLRLGFNTKKNRLIDPNYYDCVVNKLLSEDAIEGSKVNGEYIGLIEQKPDGKFDTTIDKEGVLSVEEQENLAAVMVLKEREERKNSDEQKQEGEAR